jgi:hypothetical protein
MSLDTAISQLEAEIREYGQGTLQQPKEHTKEWFLLRAAALGFSALRRMKQIGLGKDPAADEIFYRSCANAIKEQGSPQ